MSAQTEDAVSTKLIVGLGNPGPSYRHTRHNVGFDVLDVLSGRLGLQFTKQKYRGLVAEGAYKGRNITLLKPQTYMNRSGESVAEAVRYTVDSPRELLVVYDDVDLPRGKIRIREKGGPGTHRGMQSVIQRLGNDTGFPRLRIGVGEDSGTDLSRHVLGKLRGEERAAINAAVDRAVEALVCCLDAGLQRAMNVYNRDESETEQGDAAQDAD